jgi:hypothetical protein
LKHERKHERNEEGIEPKNKAARQWRTVRPGGADCPRWPRGLSGSVPRTVRTLAADCPALAADRPLNQPEPPVANLENRTVRGEHAHCSPRTSGLSARYTRTVRNFAQRKLKTTMDQKQRRIRTRRTETSWIVRQPFADYPRFTDSPRKSPTSKVNSAKSSSDLPKGRSC